MELNCLEIERFSSSRVWKEICRINEERKEGLKNDLTREGDVDNIRILQGRVAEINDFLNYPGLLLEEAKEDEGKEQ